MAVWEKGNLGKRADIFPSQKKKKKPELLRCTLQGCAGKAGKFRFEAPGISKRRGEEEKRDPM